MDGGRGEGFAQSELAWLLITSCTRSLCISARMPFVLALTLLMETMTSPIFTCFAGLAAFHCDTSPSSLTSSIRNLVRSLIGLMCIPRESMDELLVSVTVNSDSAMESKPTGLDGSGAGE